MTKEKAFFFDTADIKYIKNAWDKLSPHFNPSDVRGVTTNPNAFWKLNMNSVREWENRTKELCELVSEIRGDDEGIVYVQCPSSRFSPETVMLWIDLIKTWSDGNTNIALKIPPYPHILKMVDKISKIMDVNVTGVADCSTALLCSTYDVRYISFIPGRMDDVGINSIDQIDYFNQRNKSETELITGAMRSMESLKMMIELETVPTIGYRVFDDMFKQNREKEFSTYWDKKYKAPRDFFFSPVVTKTNHELSSHFFEEMDQRGRDVAMEFQGKK